MSFDMFILTVRDDRDDSFPRAIVEDAFRPYVSDTDGDYWNLHDADGDLRFVNMDVDVGERITNFSVNRPPDYESFPQFWEALFDVLSQTNAILAWPGDPPHPRCCVANLDFAKELPNEFVDSMGQPAMVTCGLDIVEALARTNRDFR